MRQAYKKHLIILGAYLALALIMTLPLLGLIDTHLAGSGGDPWQTMWRFGEKEALLRSSTTSYEGLMHFVHQDFFGGGEPRLVNLSVWPWMGLHVMFGQPLAYNVVWLASFMLSGFAMYLLVRHSFGRDVPAFLAGVYYMFLPYHVAHSYGHFGAMQTQWLPFIILALLVWVKRPNIWKTLVLAALLVVQAWSEHHYMLWLVLFVGLWLLFYWRRVSTFWSKRQGSKYTVVLAALLFFFVVLPYMPTIEMALQPDSSLELGQEQTVRFSADLLAYVVPASWQTIWGGFTNTVFSQNFTGNVTEATHFLGLVPLLLVLFFHHKIPRRQKCFWVTVAIFFLLVSLGPRLHVLGWVTGLPLPYAVVQDWPVFSAVRAVTRAGVFVGLAGAVLLGGVLATQLRRPVSALIILLVILLEFLFMPVPLQSAQLPEAYSVVEELSGRTLVEIPAATNYAAGSRALYAAGEHGKEVVGNIALERAKTADDFDEGRSLPALRQLLYLRTTALLENRQEFFSQDLAETLCDVLRYIDVAAILAHIDSLSEVQQEAVRYLLEDNMKLTAREYDDALLYTVNSVQGGDGVFLSRDDRWQNVGYDPKRDSVFAEIFDEASVKLYNVTGEEKRVTLFFTFAPESHGNLVVEQQGREIIRYSGAGGDKAGVMLMVPPGRVTLDFKNLLTEKVIIQNPRLEIQ